MRQRWLITILVMTNALWTRADYPLFWQRYTADPWGIEYNGRLYLFCSHDTYDAERGYGYFMNDITCISTDDLKNWTDHGEVFHASDSKWGAELTWAPCVVERDGKFFLYYGNGGNGIGVAVSDSPTGPYADNNDQPLVSLDTPGVLSYNEKGQTVKNSGGVKGALPGSENWGMWCFDPSVFVDDDGQAYLYFGGAHPDNSRVIRLKENMTETEGEAIKTNTPGFFEASCVHKYHGKYYYSYSGHYYSIPSNIDYVVSDSPMGPFSGPYVVMANPPVNDGFNHHHTIFTYQGEWYMAYHNRQVAYENGEPDKRAREFMRSVCLDRLTYDANDMIIPVIPTRDGLPQLKHVDAFSWNEAETMAKGWKIQTLETDEANRAVVPLADKAYVKICGVDFGQRGATGFSSLLSCHGNGCEVDIRLESPEGLLLGTLAVPDTGDGKSWETVSTEVTALPGVFDVYLVFKGDATNLLLDKWCFKE